MKHRRLLRHLRKGSASLVEVIVLALLPCSIEQKNPSLEHTILLLEIIQEDDLGLAALNYS